ncbi:hypothetical protein C0Q70_11758 [Pomacea canaliculata]|uniref:Uncharacterized protein n=1 Tax=Pomacea canaliculata TaxID=400727 RepID=A0A2T7P6X6_POMCA|nr:hypothetical protein C0Q70_11758 [Pomacea canaliculata]
MGCLAGAVGVEGRKELQPSAMESKARGRIDTGTANVLHQSAFMMPAAAATVGLDDWEGGEDVCSRPDFSFLRVQMQAADDADNDEALTVNKMKC